MRAGVAREVEVADPGGPPAARVPPDLGHVRLRPQVAAPGTQRPLERGDRVAFGVDRAAVAGAEPAVGAGRPAVVALAVDAGRGAVGVQARALGGLGRHQRRRHVVAGRHRERAAAPGGERVGAVVAGHAERPLHRRVVRLQVGVRHRPVLDTCPVDRPAGRAQREVLLPEPGELGVGVHPAAAHGGRHVVDLAREQPVAVGRRPPVGAGLQQRVGAEQVAAGQRHLVVGEVAQEIVGRGQVDEVVAALLQHHHRPPGRGQHLGHGGPAGPRADDHGVAVGRGHRAPAGGNSGAGKPMRAHPAPSRLPP